MDETYPNRIEEEDKTENEIEIKAKKSLGQNFLRSQKAVEKIIESAKLSKEDVVLEVGPGKGVLTEKLLEEAFKVVAIEKDERLIPELTEKFQKEISEGRFELIYGDVLEIDAENIPSLNSGFKLVANIPYYITGILIRKFLGQKNKPKLCVFMLQKEVAQRIVARDGKESLLSLSVKAYGEPKYIMKVDRESFSPKPKVDSAILAIYNISSKFFEDMSQDFELQNSRIVIPETSGIQVNSFDSKSKSRTWIPASLGMTIRDAGMTQKDNLVTQKEEEFFSVIKAGFAHKRKQLIPNLKNKWKEFPFETVFSAVKVDKKVRAEDLTLEHWKYLVKSLFKKL